MNAATVRACLLALLLPACAPAAAPPSAPAPQAAPAVKRLRVVGTTDVHGHLLPTRPEWARGRVVGGADVLAAHIDSARARFDGATVVISAGDLFQGTAISNFSWGRATIEAHNATGYDAAAVGNHEFDWGQDTLVARVRESRFPWLAANLFRAGTREHPSWVRPWVMVERAGVKVGIVGVALSHTPQMVMAGRLTGLEFGEEVPAIDAAARQARAAGADFVVVTMHVGVICTQPGREPEEESTGCSGEALEIAAGLAEPVDAIVGGHTHRRVLTDTLGIPFLEAASYGTAFSVVDLERSGGRTRVLRRAVHTPFADEVTPDTAVTRVLARWEARVRPMTERVVTSLVTPMRRQGDEFPLGNLIVDAFRSTAGAQVGLINNGSIRRDLPAGRITWGDLFELQPFGNEVVKVEITGDQLRRALENSVRADGSVDAHISGMRVTFDRAAPAGSRVREIRLDGGRILRATDRVTLGTTDFVATGGDRYAPFREGRMTRTGVVDLDALIRHIQALPQPVAAPATGRWRRTP